MFNAEDTDGSWSVHGGCDEEICGTLWSTRAKQWKHGAYRVWFRRSWV